MVHCKFAGLQIGVGIDCVKVPLAITRESIYAYSGLAGHHAEISYTSKRSSALSNRQQ
jgi:hypothetical protein